MGARGARPPGPLVDLYSGFGLFGSAGGRCPWRSRRLKETTHHADLQHNAEPTATPLCGAPQCRGVPVGGPKQYPPYEPSTFVVDPRVPDEQNALAGIMRIARAHRSCVHVATLAAYAHPD